MENSFWNSSPRICPLVSVEAFRSTTSNECASSVSSTRQRRIPRQRRGFLRCRANSPQTQPDLGHQLENAVALHLRRKARELHYAGERDLWECDFITRDAAIQVCLELTEANRGRELRGVVEGARLGGKRRAMVVTLDQSDNLRENGVSIDVVPVWRWMT